VTYRLLRGHAGVEMAVAIDKQPIESPEAFYVQFGANGQTPRIVLDIGRCAVDATTEQLEFGCRTWASVQSFATVMTDTHALTIASPDVPLVQPFGIQTEQAGDRLLADPTLGFQILNNHWDVNFNASQSGRITGRFHLFPSSPKKAGAARPQAMAVCAAPVIVRAYDAEPRDAQPLVDISSDHPVEVHMRRPAGETASVAVISNAGAEAAKGRFSIKGRRLSPMASVASQANADEDGTFSIPPRSDVRFRVLDG